MKPEKKFNAAFAENNEPDNLVVTETEVLEISNATCVWAGATYSDGAWRCAGGSKVYCRGGQWYTSSDSC